MTAENSISKEEIKSSRFSLRTILTILIAIISLGLIIAAVTAGSWFWQRANKQLQQQNQQILSLKTQLTEQQANLQLLQQHWQQLSQWQMQINRWQLTQAEYFVQLANFHLQTELNVNSALQLLKMAQNGLDVNDPALSNIQQLLSQNISALQSLTLPDPAELVTRLDTLSQQIAHLPLYLQKTATAPQDNAAANNTISPNNSKFTAFWQKHMTNFLDHLRHLVTIRYTATPSNTPQQQAVIQQALQVKLLQAEWAVLQHKSNLYQQSLQRLSEMLQQNYPLDNKFAQQVLQTLNQLQQITLAPKLPDITDTLKAIKDLRQQLNVNAASAQLPAVTPPLSNMPKNSEQNERPARPPLLIPHPPAAESITS